jgi:hypothetical protein
MDFKYSMMLPSYLPRPTKTFAGKYSLYGSLAKIQGYLRSGNGQEEACNGLGESHQFLKKEYP